MPPQRAVEASDEIDRRGVRLVDCHPVRYWNHHANEGGIGPVISDCVRDDVELRSILAGHDAVARLIPVQDETLCIRSRHDVPVCFNGRTTAWNIDANHVRVRWHPARAREAVLRGMRSLT